MAIDIGGIRIGSVAIIDDDESARDGYCEPVEELDVTAIREAGPLPNLTVYAADLKKRADGALCDYRLQQRARYAAFNGDQLVAGLYQQRLPAVLCTSFTDADVTILRTLRRYIPVLLAPSEVNPDSIFQGFERCIEEFNGSFRPNREPYRTLLRVDEIVEDGKYIYVVIPGWSPRKKLRLYFDDLPKSVASALAVDDRYYVHVNVGAEAHEEIYIADWELG